MPVSSFSCRAIRHAVLGRHHVGLDQVGAELDGEPVRFQRVLRQEGASAAVAEDERRLAAQSVEPGHARKPSACGGAGMVAGLPKTGRVRGRDRRMTFRGARCVPTASAVSVRAIRALRPGGGTRRSPAFHRLDAVHLPRPALAEPFHAAVRPGVLVAQHEQAERDEQRRPGGSAAPCRSRRGTAARSPQALRLREGRYSITRPAAATAVAAPAGRASGRWRRRGAPGW